VPDEETLKVFENFEQVSKGDARESTGIGLGLPIARRLARFMGGDVWYERRFPTGARFCFSLPLRRRAILADGETGAAEDVVGVDASEMVQSL
jgi:signal transduction histidine kinase